MNAWLVQTLVSSTLLMLFVLTVRRHAARAFGARIAYGLWLLPALRMVLPPLPGHRTLYLPVFVVAPKAVQPVRIGLMPPETVEPAFMLPDPIRATLEAAPRPAGWDWPAILLALWAGGALLWFAWQMLAYRRFMAAALATATPLATEVGVTVLASDAVTGPVAAGILRRRIFLPRDFLTRYSSAERRQALLHEGAHHDRLDLVANLAGLAVLACHWWNPIAYRAHRAFRADQELACDATVLDRADAAARYAYGGALVKSTSGRTPVAACALDRTMEIRRRLTMLKQGRPPLSRRALGAALALSAIGGGLLLTATGSGAASAVREAAPRVPPIPPVPGMPPAPPAPPAPVAVMIAPVPPVPAMRPDPMSRADQARIDAVSRDAARAGEEAARAGREAERAADAAVARIDIAAIVRSSLDAARAGVEAACAANGGDPADHGMGALPQCGAGRAELIAAMEDARAEMATDRDLTEGQRRSAVGAIDQSITRMKAERTN